MGKLGDVYCMNLFEFLEIWHPNTPIVVEFNDKQIYNGIVKEVPLEIQCKYWVKEGMVKNARDSMIIPVEHEDEINRRLKEQNTVSYFDILQNIIDDSEATNTTKEAFHSMIRSAGQYNYFRKNWNRFPIDTLDQRSKERTLSHDNFISEINGLAEIVKTETKKRLIPWRVALGNDRHKLGDFAEYIMDYIEKTKGRIEILKAIKWAQEQKDKLTDLVYHSMSNNPAKEQIMEQCNFTNEQAQAIIDMRMKAFSKKERDKISEELQECRNRLQYFPEI